VGAAIDPGTGAALLAVAPAQDYLVALSPAGAAILRPGGQAAPLDGALAGADRVVFSPSGSALVLAAGGAWQVFTGLPDAPGVAWSGSGSAPAAVSDDGAQVLAAAEGLHLVTRAGETRAILPGTDFLAAFASGSHRAAAASAGQVWVIEGGARPLARVDRPVGLAWNGEQILAAEGGANSVLLLAAETGEARRLPCECRVTTLERMGAWFRLNQLEDAPVWLLDAAAPRLWFVPAPRD
jgi:hypothetical protein